MFLTRIFGRSLSSTAKSETSAAASSATSTTARRGHNPLEEFFEVERSVDEDKEALMRINLSSMVRVGRLLNYVSWDDLQKLWYVLLTEKNMLMMQHQMLHAQNLKFPNPERIPKTRKSMC